jgi:hypothetical protein
VLITKEMEEAGNVEGIPGDKEFEWRKITPVKVA